jgi:MYXO-CTERM domain-containing protein
MVEPTPAPEDLPPPVAEEAEGESRSSLLWVVLAALLVAALAALLFWRRRKPDQEPEEVFHDAPPAESIAAPVAEPAPAAPVAAPAEPSFLKRPGPTPTAAPVPEAEPAAPSFLTRPIPEPEGLVVSTAFRTRPPAPPAVAAERPPLDFSFLPFAMGTEDGKAVVRFELGAGNPTDMGISELRFAAGMFSASPQQDAEIERFFAEVPEHAMLQPFPLEPHEARKLEATVTLALDNVTVLTAGERRFFVPVMAIDARYCWADGREARTRVAFVVGRQLQGSEKLAPVYLDRGDRMVDRLEARLHGEVRRD